MPVDTNRHHTPEDGQERLPGHVLGPIPWTCQSAACGQPQVGDPNLGCTFCGAGAPGEKVPASAASQPYDAPPALQETRQPHHPAPGDRATGHTHTAPTAIGAGAAAQIGRLAAIGIGRATVPDLASLRQVVREELQAVLGGLHLDTKEKSAVLEGLAIITSSYDQIPDDVRKDLPGPEGLAALMARIQG